MRGLSPSSVPAADQPWAGLGTFRDEPRRAPSPAAMQLTPADVGVPGVAPWACTADSCAAGRQASQQRRPRGFQGSPPGPALRTSAPLARGQQVAFAVTVVAGASQGRIPPPLWMSFMKLYSQP